MSKLFHNKDSDDSKPLFESWSFSNTNYFLFGIGLVMIFLGYLAMNQGPEGVDSFESVTLAPIMLFIGYIIFIPAALLYRDKQPETGNN